MPSTPTRLLPNLTLAAFSLLAGAAFASSGQDGSIASVESNSSSPKESAGDSIPVLDPPLTLHEFGSGELTKVFSPTGVWRLCEIIKKDEKRIKIHYCGFDAQHDEWISNDSDRLRAVTHTSPGRTKWYHHALKKGHTPANAHALAAVYDGISLEAAREQNPKPARKRAPKAKSSAAQRKREARMQELEYLIRDKKYQIRQWNRATMETSGFNMFWRQYYDRYTKELQAIQERLWWFRDCAPAIIQGLMLYDNIPTPVCNLIAEFAAPELLDENRET